MDVFSVFRSESFVWDSDKALSNFGKHGISFEQAREVFFDFLVQYSDASADDESRDAAIGMDSGDTLLLVVYVLREESVFA